MDPEYNLQDVVRCHLCETPVPPLHCVICNIHLCVDCKGKHLSDKSIVHNVVPFKYRRSFSECQKHSSKMSEHFCEQCNIPICELCVSSKKHQTHDVVDICAICVSSDEHQKQTVEELLKGFESKNLLQNHQALDEDVDPEYSLQDVVRCHICDTHDTSLHCKVCYVRLCKDCKEKHLSNTCNTKEQKVVQFKYQECITKGSNHSSQVCEHECEKCNISDCALCVSSKKHETHDVADISKSLKCNQMVLPRDLQGLKKNIHFKYPGIASHTPVQKAGQNKTSQKLTSITKHEEDFQREVVQFKYQDCITNCSNHSSQVCEHECEKCNISDCALCVSSKKHETHDVADISKSLKCNQMVLPRDLQGLKKNIHFKYPGIASHTPVQKAEQNKTSQKLTSITKHEEDFQRDMYTNISNLKADHYEINPKPKINGQHIYQQLGHISESGIKTEEHCYIMDSAGDQTSPPNRPLIDEPRIITKINTKYKRYKLRSVSCENDNNIWTCGRDKVIRLYNLQGELVESIQTEPVCNPLDIAVTKSGNVIYTDFKNKTVNIVKNRQIQTLIRLHGWKPRGVCNSSSWDLLVFMYSDDNKQTKVVCYSGSTEKKSIQYDDKGQPLYSSGSYYKYIWENTNLDICVSDNGLRAVVVVNQAGKLRFTYTGPSTPTKESLRLVGIATDSLGRILTSDLNNRCIHILDQDGQFLRYIDNCDLRCPRGLCVDTRDNLFVTEYFTGRLKKIQY